jgi:acyl carrier protein
VISEFEREILLAICRTCNLPETQIDDVGSDEPLIGPDSPLGIDSIDALEIVVMVQKEYGVRIEYQDSSRLILQSVATLAAHIQEHSPQGLKQP